MDTPLAALDSLDSLGPASPSPAGRLRVTRHYRNGERVVHSVQLHELGELHHRHPGRSVCVAWENGPKNVLVVATPHSSRAITALTKTVQALRAFGNLNVYVETDDMAQAAVPGLVRTQREQTFAQKGAELQDVAETDSRDLKVATPTVPEKSSIRMENGEDGHDDDDDDDDDDVNIDHEYIDILKPKVVTKLPWRDELCREGIEEQIDLVISLGGDGLILHVVSELFPRAVPPVIPFNMGSMGFLTPFDFRNHKAEIAHVIAGENNSVTMRMRLKCVIVPKGVVCDDWSDSSTDPSPSPPSSIKDVDFEADQPVLHESPVLSPHQLAIPSDNTPLQVNASTAQQSCLRRFHVLNEIVIDRGPAPYLSNLEVLADDCPVTRVQADGIIVATPTGSTAYSLSSGGSMVHPSVPAILFTPICPHTLSFRPVLFPHEVVLQIKVPEDARASAWASFDGRHRMELKRGDKVVICASKYPVPTLNCRDPTTDWFASVSQCLRWNERIQQSPLGGLEDEE